MIRCKIIFLLYISVDTLNQFSFYSYVISRYIVLEPDRQDQFYWGRMKEYSAFMGHIMWAAYGCP